MSLTIVATIRTGRRVHLVPEHNGRRWHRTLCNVTLSDDWRDLTRHERETLPLCDNCAARWQWINDLTTWMHEDQPWDTVDERLPS